MKIFYTRAFRKDFQNLPKRIQELAEEKLKLFEANPRHPSLQIKKMQGLYNIWEGRITNSYRFTFQMENDIYCLRRIGTHDILKKEK